MSNGQHLVSVVLPVYNCAEFVGEAISSILAQTYTNFELLIINDGSNDASAAAIASFKDPRIKVITHSHNIGLDATLNSTFSLCKGKYIARMDADDISFPKRLAAEVDFLERHPDYGMVGTLYANTDSKRKILDYGAQLVDQEEIFWGINFVNCFCHGSVMIRRELLNKFNLSYNHDYSPYEDYELWTRLVRVTKVANIPEILYLYMNNPQGMSLTQNKKMRTGAKDLSESLEKKLVLPKVGKEFLDELMKRAKIYHHPKINLTLAYQTYLYKLGSAYLRRSDLRGLSLLALSFKLSPLNWFKKILYG